MTEAELKSGLKERDAALASLDGPRIAAYLRKHGEPEAAAMLERGEETAWAGIHKARLALDLAWNEREVSRLWLKAYGFKVEAI